MTNDRQPGDTNPNAGRASGYVDEAGRAIGEDLVNRVTELLLPVQVNLNLFRTEVKTELEMQGNIRRRQFEELTTHSDARQTAIISELDAIQAAIQEVGGRVGKLETQHGALAGQLSDLSEQVGDMLVRLDTDEARLDTKREQLGQHDTRLATIEGWVAAQPTPEQSQQLIGVLMSQQAQLAQVMAHLFPGESDVIESFRLSRDASIAERQELRANDAALRADVAALNERLVGMEPMIHALYDEMSVLRGRRHDAENGGDAAS